MHTSMRTKLLVVAGTLMALVVLSAYSESYAANHRLIPFQGRLTDAAGAPFADNTYTITFAIYDKPTGGVPLWDEIHSNVSVIGGQINVLLGSITDFDDLNGDGNTSDAVYFTEPRFLGIKVGPETNQEMVPRQQIVPSFHARTAEQATTADFAQQSYGEPPVGLIAPFFGDPATLPENWLICDGSTVSDAESPLNGKVLPDLRVKFVRGEQDAALDVLSAGVNSGGNDQHSHGIDSETVSGSIDSAGSHSHQGSTGTAYIVGGTAHRLWGTGDDVVFPNGGFADGWQLSSGGSSLQGWPHEHLINSSSNGDHTHTFSAGSHDHGGNTNSTDTIPAYVELHDIIRIT